MRTDRKWPVRRTAGEHLRSLRWLRCSVSKSGSSVTSARKSTTPNDAHDEGRPTDHDRGAVGAARGRGSRSSSPTCSSTWSMGAPRSVSWPGCRAMRRATGGAARSPAPTPGRSSWLRATASGIVGSVQLHPAWAPNQPHRADVAKLLVHQRARRRGLARALMADLEARAAANGFTLLVLDTCQGTAGRGAVPRPRLDRGRRHPAFRAHAGWRELRYGVFLQAAGLGTRDSGLGWDPWATRGPVAIH